MRWILNIFAKRDLDFVDIATIHIVTKIANMRSINSSCVVEIKHVQHLNTIQVNRIACSISGMVRVALWVFLIVM